LVKYGSGRGRRVAFVKLRKRCGDIVNIGRREIFVKLEGAWNSFKTVYSGGSS
jgi:hypothetical protein